MVFSLRFGALGAVALSWGVATYALELPWSADPLMTAIDEHHSKSSVFGGSITRSMPQMDFNAVPNSYPTYQRQAPAYSGSGPQTPTATPSGQPSKDSYYPPPPLSDSYGQGTSGPRSSLTLPGGRPVFFEGTNVYTLNEQGNRIPVPDGVYAMLNGRVNMYVQGGQKISMVD